ncbi:hypothetical protein R1sor_009966 [Riccia sorocarpa]|uniref:Uncharacterized protein n=1 Tax=Riccia sorocarpa TaxID=122646 RepID=A0ABD3I072_9MARC
MALIAWTEIQKSKEGGGLALTSFENISKNMRMKQMAKLFLQEEEEWVQAAGQLIKSVKRARAGARERRNWSTQEILLLDAPKRIPGAPTVSGLLDCWNEVKLKWKLDRGAQLPRRISIVQYTVLAMNQEWMTEMEARSCRKFLKREQRIDAAWETGDAAKIALFTSTMWCIWLERNAKTYNDKDKSIPFQIAGKLASEKLTAIKEGLRQGSPKYAALENALKEIVQGVIGVENPECSLQILGTRGEAERSPVGEQERERELQPE